MKRAWLVRAASVLLLASVLLASPALADVTMTATVSMNAGPMAMNGSVVSFLKGGKFRTDAKIASQDLSILIDPATGQQWLVNHVTRQIEPAGGQQAMAGMPVNVGAAKVSVTPTGQTKEILGRSCQGFTIEMTAPMTIGAEALTMKMSGPVWLAKDGPGVAEYRATQKALTGMGLSTSPFAQGPSAQGFAEVAKALADAGIVMEQELRMTMEGTGQLAQVMGQMGNMTMTMKVTAISTDPVPDDKFVLPAGYTKK
jgi:hypothetical protein